MLSARKLGPFMVRRIPTSKLLTNKTFKRSFISPVEIVDSITVGLQALHATTGIPWWLLIPVTTVAFRTVWTLPFAVLQRKRAQKQAELRPIVNATGPILRLKLASNAQRAKDSRKQDIAAASDPTYKKFLQSNDTTLSYEQILLLSAKEQRKRQKQLFKDNNCQLYKNFILPVFQIPLWVAMSFAFRNLSGWTDTGSKPLDPSLMNEGLFWAQDLSAADPSGVLPIVLGSFAMFNVEWNNRTMELQNYSSSKRSLRPTAFDSLMNISRLGVVFLMAVSTQAPAALSLYWISSNAFSSVQNVILDYYLPLRYSPYSRFSPKKADKDSSPLFTRNLQLLKKTI